MRRRILAAPPSGDVKREIHRIRLRMESEIARESLHRHDFKTGRGGILDVENAVQCLQLIHGNAHPELFDVEPIAVQLERLEALGLLAADDAKTLEAGWDLLQNLSSRLRVVENRSISDLDEERGDLEALALQLGYTSPQRAGGARRALLEDYRRRTGEIRSVYLRILGVEGTEASGNLR
jgi:glutamate-ammonia-ligase adenylyltransferase